MFNKKEKPLLSSFDFSKIQPLENAFAHNDEQFNYPLLDALKLGFKYIEADIHLIKNEIFVGHRKPIFPNPNKTLTKLYLEPLFELFNQNSSSIFQQPNSNLHLIFDIKTEANSTYEVLKRIIKPFHSMLSFWENKKEHSSALKILLSGNRPIESIVSEEKSFFFLDGRIEDLEKNYPFELMPIISQKYSKIFDFSFFSNILSEKNMKKFNVIVEDTHNQNKLFRLWNIPEKEHVWTLLLKNDLDIISTDKIDKLSLFLKKK